MKFHFFYFKLWSLLWIFFTTCINLLGQNAPDRPTAGLSNEKLDSFAFSILPSELNSLRFYSSAISKAGIRYTIPFKQQSVLTATDASGKQLFNITDKFSEGIQVLCNDQGVFVLDAKQKEIVQFDALKGDLLGRYGSAIPEKLKHPSSIGLFSNGQWMVLDNSKNLIHLFEATGKYLNAFTPPGLQSAQSAGVNAKDEIFVLDDKLNAILKFNAEGKALSSAKLTVSSDKPNGKPGQIHSFWVDPLGFLQIFNSSTEKIEIYRWDNLPLLVSTLSKPGKDGSFKKLEFASLDPSNYELQTMEDGGKLSQAYRFYIKPPKPDNVYGFELDGTRLKVSFRLPKLPTANRFGLVTTTENGEDSLAYTTHLNYFIVDEKSINKGRSRRYRLVSLNPSGTSEATTGFDNFYGLGNHFYLAEKFDDAAIAYQNALRYMGRPPGMVQYISLKLLDMGKQQLNKNKDHFNGLNLLKTAYNLNARNLEIQKGLAFGYDVFFWKLATQDNFNTIADEAAKVIDIEWLRPSLVRTIDSIASVFEKLPNASPLNNARMLRLKLIEWMPEQASYPIAAYHTSMRLYELKAKAGAPQFELDALIFESERNIKKGIELLTKTNKSYASESILLFKALSLGRKYPELEATVQKSISSQSAKLTSQLLGEFREYLAAAFKGQKKYAEAISEYNYLLSSKPDNTQLMVAMADALYLHENYAEAKVLYKQLLVKDRNNADYTGRIGLVELGSNNNEEASFQLEKAVKLDPSNRQYYGPLGEAFEKSSNYQKALDNYKVAIQYLEQLNNQNRTLATGVENVKSTLIDYQDKIAKLYERIGAYDEAIKVYKKITGSSPERATAWFGLGNACLSSGLVYDAMKAFQSAQSLEPSNNNYQAAFQNAIKLRNDISRNEEPVTIAELSISEIYPSLYLNYSDLNLLPVGQVIITNNTSLPLKPTSISLEIPGLMDQPTFQKSITLISFSNSTLSLSSLFSEKILDLTQARKFQAQITVTYTLEGKPRTTTKTVPVTVNARNSINWSDKRKLASFISSGIEELGKYSRAGNEIYSESPKLPLNDNLRKALQIYTMLSKENLVYTPDPELAYSSVSTNTNMLDYLQFPTETLQRKIGDCDDLVTLYSALLENSGISTAYVDIPGHIFMAIDLRISADQAAEAGFRPQDIIIYQDKVWLPVETTLLGQAPFIQAWEKGASRYHQEILKGNFPEMVSLADAHKVYHPSSYISKEYILTKFNTKAINEEYTTQLYRVFGKINESSMAEVKTHYLNEQTNIYIKNKYAILLAQSGKSEEAKDVLKEALILSPENASIYNNLGNIYYQQGNFQEAVKNYEKSYNFDKTDLLTLINMSKAYLASGDKSSAKKWFDIAESIDQNISQQYQQLLIKIK